MSNIIQNAFRWTQSNAPTISGYLGLAAGGCVLAAGGSSLDNPSLVVAGVLEWTSFGTTALWGKNDSDDGVAKKVDFSLSKGILPWRYPVESFVLQQGLAGLFYGSAGVDWKLVGSSTHHLIEHTINTSSGSFIKDASLLVVSGLCIAATTVQNTVKERAGLLHPRTLSSGCLLASCFAIAASAATEHSALMGVAAGLFALSNISSGISRRKEGASIPAPAP